ncbi:hypothetical protein [Kocuria sp. CPCC 205263]|uniref:hypothetical protein n=1 Tax=Kocuria sp. CPCC 205263 TaxID=3073555 RepID=UPI0034D5FFEC
MKASELSKTNIGQWVILGGSEDAERGTLVEVEHIPELLPSEHGQGGRGGVSIALHAGRGKARRVEQFLELNQEVIVGDSPDEVVLARALN